MRVDKRAGELWTRGQANLGGLARGFWVWFGELSEKISPPNLELKAPRDQPATDRTGLSDLLAEASVGPGLSEQRSNSGSGTARAAVFDRAGCKESRPTRVSLAPPAPSPASSQKLMQQVADSPPVGSLALPSSPSPAGSAGLLLHSFNTLHKRMEATLAAASHSSGTAAEISKATASSARTLSGAHTPTLPAYSEVQIDAIKSPHLPPPPGSTRQRLENGRLSPADSPHSTDLSLTSHLPSPEPPKINPIVRFKERFFLRWKNIFLSIRRFPNLLVPAPRTFSYAPQLAADFEKLKGIPDLPDFANRFIEDLLNRPEKWKSIMRGKEVVNDVGDIKKKTGETLSNIRQLISVDFPQNEAAVSKRSEEIAQKLQPIFKASGKQTPEQRLSKFGSQLARYKSVALQDSRNAPLADLHGFLGPDNVFSSQLALMLRDSKIVGRLPNNFVPDDFIDQLKELQTHLTALDNHRALHFQALKAGENRLPHPFELGDKVGEFQKTQLELFKYPEAFQGFISKLKTSEPYRGFQAELNSPKDIAGYELAFVEPLGIAKDHDIGAHKVESIQKLKVPVDRSFDGIQALNGDLKTLALQNTAQRLSIASQAWDLREQLLNIFTPEGVKYLIKSIPT
ncbi:hypothetical protein PCANC_08581 [Puccinia coronata f. sp. avenae]|uniref:Uncharacterized protein n=1 Tax=Puccinia coronata f. sp. avenae TaxID=200324 RepID=A0A2N5V1W6_9BASI|nr:hypothetical protein PCANC_08581 [Puccinia coronata f. sp. avenae]